MTEGTKKDTLKSRGKYTCIIYFNGDNGIRKLTIAGKERKEETLPLSV